ncbi:MAG: hypothetical protein DSZ16_05005 [Candidatus Thioglobus sp.]|nr:MAG: hypothetical protein DSZ16_05005 [Candidatus Thioglobus sp.]
MRIIQNNFLAFVIVLTSLIMIEGIGYMNFTYGNLLFLPVGAEIFVYLLFGFRVLPGVMIANTIVGYFLWNSWFGNDLNGFIGHVIIGSLSPLLALYIMKIFNLSNFIDSKLIEYKHILFSIILTALISTLGKFMFFWGIIKEPIEPLSFISSYMVGDILGGAVFIYFAIKILHPLLLRFKLT